MIVIVYEPAGVDEDVAIVTVDVPKFVPAVELELAPAGSPLTVTGRPPLKMQLMFALATAE